MLCLDAIAEELFVEQSLGLKFLHSLPLQNIDGQKTVNQYVKLRRLGTGSYGKVVLHKDSITNKLYAMKILHRWAHFPNDELAHTVANISGALARLLQLPYISHLHAKCLVK